MLRRFVRFSAESASWSSVRSKRLQLNLWFFFPIYFLLISESLKLPLTDSFLTLLTQALPTRPTNKFFSVGLWKISPTDAWCLISLFSPTIPWSILLYNSALSSRIVPPLPNALGAVRCFIRAYHNHGAAAILRGIYRFKLSDQNYKPIATSVNFLSHGIKPFFVALEKINNFGNSFPVAKYLLLKSWFSCSLHCSYGNGVS